MKTKISDIWHELLLEPVITRKLVFRRWSAKSAADIFLGIRDAAHIRFAAFAYKKSLQVRTVSFNRLKDIRVEVIESPENATQAWLMLCLLNPELEDNFTALCIDLITAVQDERQDKSLLSEILRRLEHWQALFDEYQHAGLSPEVQRGLYGELMFLHHLVEVTNQPFAAVQSWIGPTQYQQDFRSGLWAAEVKTTSGTNNDRLTISNTLQLDDTNLEDLFLIHYWLEISPTNTATLNQAVEKLRHRLETDSSAFRLFNQRLSEAGYNDLHSGLYAETGYVVRKKQYWKINKNFPRLTVNMIPEGLEDVKYILLAAVCREWLIDESEMFTKIRVYVG